MKITQIRLTLMLLVLGGTLASAAPMGTAFTYQGRLFDGTNAANGLYDLRFTLYDAPGSGNLVAGPGTNTAVTVANGLFTTTLDFGSGAFNGDARWLEIAARTNGGASFSTFLPRQTVTPTPYALDAANATTFGGQLPSYYAPASGSSAYVAKSGDTMTGMLNLPANGMAAGGSQFVLSAGNVGIGTTAPATKLDVIGTLQASSFQGDASGLTGLNANNITSGMLANGRLSADVPLLNSASVSFSGQVSANTLRAGNTSLTMTAIQGTAGNSTGVYGASTSGTGVRGYSSSGAGVFGQSVSSFGVYANSGTGFGLDASGGNVGVYAHNTSGTPGRDVYLSTAALAGDFYGDLNIRDNTFYLRGGSNHGLGWFGSSKTFGTNTFDGPVLFGWNGGALGSTMFGRDWTLMWDPWGWVRVRGGIITPSAQIAGTTTTGVLQINGGSDVAEPFEVSDKDIPKGAVVVIDPENPGQLRQSDRAYDTRVAGIISGANGIQPGLTLRQKGVMDGSQNVALSGRVYALADASNGAIQPGDLLTTSAIPGHAMRVTDHAQAQGAILGKAMSGLATGRGMVLVLVSLQ